MISSTLLLILASGVPYFIVLEREKLFSPKQIFMISSFLLVCAVVFSFFISNDHPAVLIIISLLSAIYAIYKAHQSTNFYKLGYYFIFVNAPFFVMFEEAGAHYSAALLATLGGIYLIARFYEKHYGSANYYNITGVTTVTPCVGTFLSLYLIALALYPPFPNALFFLSHVFSSDTDPLWFAVVITLFFGNFFLAMRVMRKTLFGRPNPNIHYVSMSVQDKAMHSGVLFVLLILSIFGLQEVLL